MNPSAKTNESYSPPVVKVRGGEADTSENIYLCLSKMLGSLMTIEHQPVILCIGSDRATGDSLGPLTGSKLYNLRPRNFPIFGTLREPVHALNLIQHIGHIKNSTDSPFVIAIDASLGTLESVGSIEIGMGPIKPGLAVNKKLPEIGDLYVTGIVNIGGFMEQMVLQSTRLYQVMNMAEAISVGLNRALQEIICRLNCAQIKA